MGTALLVCFTVIIGLFYPNARMNDLKDSFNKRIDDLKASMDHRFDDLKKSNDNRFDDLKDYIKSEFNRFDERMIAWKAPSFVNSPAYPN